MANKKYKGILKEDLICRYGTKLLKGQEVIVHKRSIYDAFGCRTREFEYHYSDANGKNLIRDSRLLIDLS
jgi:hypothetical protein